MIGYVLQALNADRNRKLKPRVIPSSLFVQRDSFGISSSDEDDENYENLSFDLLIDESHEIDFDITDHAVENGTVISDHIQKRLRSVQISGMFTDHPVNKGNTWVTDDEETVLEADSVDLVDPDQVNVQMGHGIVPSSVRKWNRLKALADRRSKVRLVTALEIFDEMVIESLSTSRGPGDGESIKFSMRLREVRVASVKSVTRKGVWEPPQPAKLDTPEAKAVGKEEQNGKKTGFAADAEKIGTKLDNAKGGTTITP